MTIVSDSTIWSITYDHNWLHYLRLELARIINYDHNCSFIVLATVITIVNYNCKTFVVQATGLAREVFYNLYEDDSRKEQHFAIIFDQNMFFHILS
jgi:hypothetical protein